MDSTELTWSTFLRVTSISVATYDFLITIPAEWRMYRSKGSMRFGFSLGKILFILIRYVSIVLLTVSDVGYFYHGFSAAACSRYYMIAPVLKVIQIMISQAIIGYRTWAITRQSKELGVFLLGLGFIVTTLEWYATVRGRTPSQDKGNCAPANARTGMPQWVFYLMAMLFDAVTCVISTFFLVRFPSGISRMSLMAKMLFYDGLGYMVTLTAVNILNLVLFWESVGKGNQSSGASFEYMVVWIMSQQILIHIHDTAEGRAHRGVFVNHQISAPRDGSHEMRFNTSTRDGTETTTDVLDVQVQIEQTSAIDYNLSCGREDHRKTWAFWDKKKVVTDGEEFPTVQDKWEFESVKSVAKTTNTV